MPDGSMMWEETAATQWDGTGATGKTAVDAITLNKVKGFSYTALARMHPGPDKAGSR